MRNPIEDEPADAREPINRPDTFERFRKCYQILDCEQQPTHTWGPFLLVPTRVGSPGVTNGCMTLSEGVGVYLRLRLSRKGVVFHRVSEQSCGSVIDVRRDRPISGYKKADASKQHSLRTASNAPSVRECPTRSSQVRNGCVAVESRSDRGLDLAIPDHHRAGVSNRSRPITFPIRHRTARRAVRPDRPKARGG